MLFRRCALMCIRPPAPLLHVYRSRGVGVEVGAYCWDSGTWLVRSVGAAGSIEWDPRTDFREKRDHRTDEYGWMFRGPRIQRGRSFHFSHPKKLKKGGNGG